MTAPADYLDSLSRFACETAYADIPQPVHERCKVIIADLLAVIALGCREPEMQALAASQLPRVAPCVRRSSHRQRCNPLDAAMLNATRRVWLELERGNFDTMAIRVHVIPAALAHAH